MYAYLYHVLEKYVRQTDEISFSLLSFKINKHLYHKEVTYTRFILPHICPIYPNTCYIRVVCRVHYVPCATYTDSAASAAARLMAISRIMSEIRQVLGGVGS